MKTRFLAVLFMLAVILSSVNVFAMGKSEPTPPGKAAYGYGSGEDYICNGFTEIAFGAAVTVHGSGTISRPVETAPPRR